ncbi:transcription termination/antitermination factor NusG [Peptostreptococcaceae bacterium oral taxon 113 str. W5053]|nr:transcription termination/antitermination factor NusG [Peptostreptococcaceae bacterium oral taxon 113 str. W5053]
MLEEFTDKQAQWEERSKDGKWYVVHTYSGHENKVKANIEKMVENRGYIDDIFQVLVPMENYIDSKGGTNEFKERKLFPGYVFVKMVVNDVTWFLVRNTRGVTGFVGPGTKPVPLRDDEVTKFGIREPRVGTLEVNVGDRIRVCEGPFQDFTGEVNSVNHEKNKLNAYLSIFGRETLVELDFDNIEIF